MNRTVKSEKISMLLNQGFIPIMVKDDLDTKMLVEAVVEAGCDVIEYTCRRPDARRMIPWIKQEFPDLLVLGASLVDGVAATKYLKEKNDNFISVDEMVELGVDGLISFMKFRPETYKRYSGDLVIIPGVATHNEALDQFEMGADFIKVMGGNPQGSNFLRNSNAVTHNLFSYFISGGMTDAKILEYAEAGASLFGGGFDLLLNENPEVPPQKNALSLLLKNKIATVKSARMT